MFINPVLSPREGYHKSELVANKRDMESPLILSGKIVSTKRVMDEENTICEVYLGMLDDESYPQILKDEFAIVNEENTAMGTVSFELNRRRLLSIHTLTWSPLVQEDEILSTQIHIEIR